MKRTRLSVTPAMLYQHDTEATETVSVECASTLCRCQFEQESKSVHWFDRPVTRLEFLLGIVILLSIGSVILWVV